MILFLCFVTDGCQKLTLSSANTSLVLAPSPPHQCLSQYLSLPHITWPALRALLSSHPPHLVLCHTADVQPCLAIHTLVQALDHLITASTLSVGLDRELML